MANVSNIIRARIEASDPKAIAELCGDAKQAAADRILELCTSARGKIGKLPIHEELWSKQVDDILESYAAWTAIADGEGYGDGSKRLGGLLASRKATRDFLPAADSPDGLGYGVPKSSLDAARESVINVPRGQREKIEYRTPFRKLGLSGREELDALALAKRLAGEPDQFTAYSRVAADSWIESLTAEQQRAIANAYEPLVPPDNDLATRVRGNHGIYYALPYDAQLLYEFRLDNARARRDLTPDEHQHLRKLHGTLRHIGRQKNAEDGTVGGPVPYAVILKADGDRMGKLLAGAKEAEESRNISKALHEFASSVPETVRNHRGHAIYSGGDDVLALVPLTRAVEAADELRKHFASAMDPVAAALGVHASERPTLSVGLGIGHVMEPLGALRARADAAEKAAKGNDLDERIQRNALAIQLGLRSGAEYRWRGRWDPTTILDDLLTYKRAYQRAELPSRVAYDLRSIAQRLGWLNDWTRSEGEEDPDRKDTAKGMREAEVRRMLERARTDAGNKAVPKALRERLCAETRHVPLNDLADKLIIGRWLAARTAADVGGEEND